MAFGHYIVLCGVCELSGPFYIIYVRGSRNWTDQSGIHNTDFVQVFPAAITDSIHHLIIQRAVQNNFFVFPSSNWAKVPVDRWRSLLGVRIEQGEIGARKWERNRGLKINWCTQCILSYLSEEERKVIRKRKRKQRSTIVLLMLLPEASPWLNLLLPLIAVVISIFQSIRSVEPSRLC